jgi:hypothetical protein
VKITLPDSHIEIEIKTVPPFMVRMLCESVMPEPQAPIIKIKSVAGHEEDFANTQDEAYQRKRNEWQGKRNALETDIMLAHGVVVTMPEADEWAAPLNGTDISLVNPPKPFTVKQWRQLLYLRCVAFQSMADYRVCTELLYSAAYPDEERITAIVSSFRNHA